MPHVWQGRQMPAIPGFVPLRDTRFVFRFHLNRLLHPTLLHTFCRSYQDLRPFTGLGGPSRKFCTPIVILWLFIHVTKDPQSASGWSYLVEILPLHTFTSPFPRNASLERAGTPRPRSYLSPQWTWPSFLFPTLLQSVIIQAAFSLSLNTCRPSDPVYSSHNM